MFVCVRLRKSDVVYFISNCVIANSTVIIVVVIVCLLLFFVCSCIFE